MKFRIEIPEDGDPLSVQVIHVDHAAGEKSASLVGVKPGASCEIDTQPNDVLIVAPGK